jgi:hypothetical protein
MIEVFFIFVPQGVLAVATFIGEDKGSVQAIVIPPDAGSFTDRKSVTDDLFRFSEFDIDSSAVRSPAA